MHNPETRRFGHTLVDYPGKSLRDLGISAVYEEESGDLWLGGREGVHKFDRDGKLTARLTHDPRKPEQSICFGRITTLWADHRGDMWIGTNGGGISRVSKGGLGSIQNYNNDGPNSLAHDAVNKIFENRLPAGNNGAGPDSVATGTYRVELEVYLFDPGQRREAFGIFVGGSDLDGPDQAYTYFLIRNGGQYLVKERAGSDTPTIQGWTAHESILSYEDREEGGATILNTLVVDVGQEEVRFMVNGEEVYRMSREGRALDGVVGLRVNHGLNLHISRLETVSGG